MNATPLSKLPPPTVQSRRPEPPQGMAPGGPSDGARKSKDVNAPTYADLLRQMDAVADEPQQYESYDEGYPDPDESQYPPAPVPEQQYRPPPQRQPSPRPREQSMTAAPPAPPHSLVWRHRYTILVAVIMMVMLMYGVPKLQVAAPTLFSPMTMYKLNVTGAAVVAVSAAGIYATLSTYVL